MRFPFERHGLFSGMFVSGRVAYSFPGFFWKYSMKTNMLAPEKGCLEDDPFQKKLKCIMYRRPWFIFRGVISPLERGQSERPKLAPPSGFFVIAFVSSLAMLGINVGKALQRKKTGNPAGKTRSHDHVMAGFLKLMLLLRTHYLLDLNGKILWISSAFNHCAEPPEPPPLVGPSSPILSFNKCTHGRVHGPIGTLSF